MADHDNKSVRFGHHEETIHPLPKGGSARIRPRKATGSRSTSDHQYIETERVKEHPSPRLTDKQSKASESRPLHRPTDRKSSVAQSRVSAPGRTTTGHTGPSATPSQRTTQGTPQSRTTASTPIRTAPRQKRTTSTSKGNERKSNPNREKKGNRQGFLIDPSKIHHLKPLLLRYIMPLVIITLVLSLMTVIDMPEKIIAPAYSMEDFMNRKPYHYKGSYNRDFNDLNDLQLTAATKLGIRPAETREEAALSKRLVPIKCGEVICIDHLTHSQALLVPRAHDLLEQIGSTFMGRLAEDKLPLYRVILTSGTRTREDVGNLRKRNGNASENSTHMYGTTFDISWRRFDKVDPNDPRSLDPSELKHLLAIVLKDFHDKGYCYIKHERRQACFHITTRP